MAYAQIAKGLGQVLGKGFLRNLGGKKAVKEIAQESLLSGGLNFGLGIGGQVKLFYMPVQIHWHQAHHWLVFVAQGHDVHEECK